MMIDKIVFGDDVAEAADMPAALLMMCPRINDAQIALCYSMTAVEVARVILCSGIPQYSIPTIIISDVASMHPLLHAGSHLACLR